MSLFDLLSPGELAENNRSGRANGVFVSQLPKPGWFGNSGGAVGNGLMRGGADTAHTINLLAAAPMVVYEGLTGQEGKYTDPWFRAIDDDDQSAIDYWQPDPATTGAGARVLGQLAESAVPLMAGGGSPEFLIANAGTGTASDRVRQGVPAGQAVLAGDISAATTALGLKLPLGNTLVQRLASGAIGNAALNAAGRAAQQQVLQGTPQAQDYGLNPSALLVDGLMGGIFGGMSHFGAREAPRSGGEAPPNPPSPDSPPPDPSVPPAGGSPEERLNTETVERRASIAANSKMAGSGLVRGEGRYGDLAGTLDDGFQAHHLNQNAVFTSVIPRNDGFSIGIQGNAFRDLGSPHYKFHSSLDNFFEQYREDGSLFGERPTNKEYDDAVNQALQDAGLTPNEAQRLTDSAAQNRQAFGLKSNDPVPRIPGRIHQSTGN